jgi:hypothetical protein
MVQTRSRLTPEQCDQPHTAFNLAKPLDNSGKSTVVKALFAGLASQMHGRARHAMVRTCLTKKEQGKQWRIV